MNDKQTLMIIALIVVLWLLWRCRHRRSFPAGTMNGDGGGIFSGRPSGCGGCGCGGSCGGCGYRTDPVRSGGVEGPGDYSQGGLLDGFFGLMHVSNPIPAGTTPAPYQSKTANYTQDVGGSGFAGMWG